MPEDDPLNKRRRSSGDGNAEEKRSISKKRMGITDDSEAIRHLIARYAEAFAEE